MLIITRFLSRRLILRPADPSSNPALDNALEQRVINNFFDYLQLRANDPLWRASLSFSTICCLD